MTVAIIESMRSGRLRRVAADERLREIVVFLLVGGISAAFYLVLNVLFTRAGLRPSLSIIWTLVILVPPTYLAQRRFTFRSDRNHVSAFPRYAGTQLLGNALALVVAELFPTPIRAHPTVAYFSDRAHGGDDKLRSA